MKKLQQRIHKKLLFVCVVWFIISYTYAVIIPAPSQAQGNCISRLKGNDNILSSSDREKLQRQIKTCQKEIEKDQADLLKKQIESTNTESLIQRIDYKVNQAALLIRASDLSLHKLGQEIKNKDKAINTLNDEIHIQQKILSNLMQQINENEQEGFLSLILSDFSLSSFFSRTGDYESLRLAVVDSIQDVTSLRNRRLMNVDELNSKKQEEQQVKGQRVVAANSVKEEKTQKEIVLAYQKKEEKEVEDKIDEKNKKIAQIESRLFELSGGGAIEFGEAVRIAEFAKKLTGINPAFLLGLIKHESDLGRNVGTGNWRVDMHPVRDQPIFPYITRQLGFEPDELRVSANPGFGWGGAMGPAQFIPSTWVEYGGFVNTRTGKCCYNGKLLTSENNLTIGSTGSDVRRLQVFLNKQGFTIASSGPGSSGNETSTYGNKVAIAVSRFQEEYAKYILSPSGYRNGTGIVGPRTKTAINLLNFYSGPWRYEKNKDKVRSLIGSSSPSNPWRPRDAFIASSLYLVKLGAKKNECTAARRYYAGGNWRSNVARNYCNSVLANANIFQIEIDFLRS